MGNMHLLYMISITFMIVVSMIIMFFICHNNIVFHKMRKIRFYIVFSCVIALALLDLADWYIQHSQSGAWISTAYIIKYFQLALGPAIPLMLVTILTGNYRKHIPLYTYIGYCLILGILTFSGVVFNYDELCNYTRHPVGFYFYAVAFILATIYLLVESILLSIKMLSKYPYPLFILFGFLLTACIVQLFYRHIHYAYAFGSIILIIFYDYISSFWNQMDGLTGLYSQFSFIVASKHIKDGEAIFVLDADDFKLVNDKYGHIVGDEVLKEIAKVIQIVFGKVGRCFRYGGDEFVVIVNKSKDYEGLIENFKTKIKETMENSTHFTNVSIGYSVYKKGSEVELSADLADKQMYLDKARNKKQLIS